MKRVIFTIVFLLAAWAAGADDQSAALLRKMTAAFSHAPAYQIDFKASMPGEFENLPGQFTVSGKKYLLDVYESQICFDGTTVYNFSEMNDEVVLDNPDPTDNSIFANPTLIFQLYDTDFDHTFKGTQSVGGKEVSVVELTPKQPGSGYNTIVLKLDNQTALPVSISYDMTDMGGWMELSIARIDLNPKVTDEMFVFDRSKYPNVEVIDFR